LRREVCIENQDQRRRRDFGADPQAVVQVAGLGAFVVGP
jgi:hypothetical protein